jgi:hypothetical protein
MADLIKGKKGKQALAAAAKDKFAGSLGQDAETLNQVRKLIDEQ